MATNKTLCAHAQGLVRTTRGVLPLSMLLLNFTT